MERISYLGQNLMRWKVGKSTFLALPEKGARLMNWNLTLGDGSVRDVIYWPELTTLDDFHLVRGGNPILVPFNGRSFADGEIFFWKDAQGVKRPMPLHGIARQGDFKLLKADPYGFSAQFVPGAEAKECYPFDYDFTVSYRFEPFGLACEYSLTNLGTSPLPWSAGHHFYFTVPWTAGSARSDYLIRIPATERLRQDARGELIAGPQLQGDQNLANPDLINTFHTGLKSSEVRFGEKGKPGDIVINLGAERVPPPNATFVTWSLAPESPFYCVEPWMGPANAAGHKRGLSMVAPGERETFTVTVAVK